MENRKHSEKAGYFWKSMTKKNYLIRFIVSVPIKGKNIYPSLGIIDRVVKDLTLLLIAFFRHAYYAPFDISGTFNSDRS